MTNGTIKFFNAAKKFGFVSPDDGGKDVFIPIASMAAAGIAALVAGQRVSFETAPEGRGPKAVNLKLIDIPVPASAATLTAPSSKAEGRAEQLIFYHDPTNENACNVLAELHASGFEPRVVDYVATPPSADELSTLSMHLSKGSLVRRYDPLFHDLRLDDRFISQNEFWAGIFENPSLINGPVLATKNIACICRSDDAAKHFLASMFPGHRAFKEKLVAERAIELSAEFVANKAIAANSDTATLEVSHVEPVVPAAELLSEKNAIVPPKKKKGVGIKTVATKPARAASRKEPLKSAVVRPKLPAI